MLLTMKLSNISNIAVPPYTKILGQVRPTPGLAPH